MKLIKTGSDSLIDLVNKEKRIPIADAAKKLKVSKDRITTWVDVLSKDGIIGIYYPLTGDGILIKGGGSSTKEKISAEEEAKTADHLIFLMKGNIFLKFDSAVRKLGVEPETLKRWVEELEKEGVIESETFFFGDVGLMRGKNFSNRLAELMGKKEKEKAKKEEGSGGLLGALRDKRKKENEVIKSGQIKKQ